MNICDSCRNTTNRAAVPIVVNLGPQPEPKQLLSAPVDGRPIAYDERRQEYVLADGRSVSRAEWLSRARAALG